MTRREQNECRNDAIDELSSIHHSDDTWRSAEKIVDAIMDAVKKELEEDRKSSICKDDPCCEHAGEYNGYTSGPLIFNCPKNCPCHD